VIYDLLAESVGDFFSFEHNFADLYADTRLPYLLPDVDINCACSENGPELLRLLKEVDYWV